MCVCREVGRLGNVRTAAPRRIALTQLGVAAGSFIGVTALVHRHVKAAVGARVAHTVKATRVHYLFGLLA